MYVALHAILLSDSFVILKHWDSFHPILSSFLLLQTLLKLSLKPFFTVQASCRLVPLLLLIHFERALICIVTLLFAVEADDFHVLHCTYRVHRLNLSQFRLAYLLLLTVGGLVAIHTASVTNDFGLMSLHKVLPAMHLLRDVHFAVDPILFSRKVSQHREGQVLWLKQAFHMDHFTIRSIRTKPKQVVLTNLLLLILMPKEAVFTAQLAETFLIIRTRLLFLR